MTTQDMDILARKIVSLEKRHNSLARAQQLPNSSVRIVDGDDVGLSDAVESVKDTSDETANLGEWLYDADSNIDNEAEHSVAVPDWIQDVGNAVDIAWDSTEFATDLALQLETDLGEAKQELEQAQIDLTQAMAEAEAALNAADNTKTLTGDLVRYPFFEKDGTTNSWTKVNGEGIIIDSTLGNPGTRWLVFGTNLDGRVITPPSTWLTWLNDGNPIYHLTPGRTIEVSVQYSKTGGTASVVIDYANTPLKTEVLDNTSGLEFVTFRYTHNQGFTFSPRLLINTSTMDGILGDTLFVTQVTARDVTELVALETGVQTAQTAANGKNRVWYQATAPTGSDHRTNDVWFNTDNDMQMSRWSGSAWLVTEFGTNAIAELSITNALIANATISDAKIATLDAAKITTGELSANRIAALSITAEKLAADSITSEKIFAGAVTADKIATNAVTADKIIANAVTADKIAANAIVAGKIAAEAIDGMTITGALIRTAPSGQRLQFDTYGLRAFNGSGVETSSLAASTGGLALSGGLGITSPYNSNRMDITSQSVDIRGEYVNNVERHKMLLRPSSLIFHKNEMPDSAGAYEIMLDGSGLSMFWGRPSLGLQAQASLTRIHSSGGGQVDYYSELRVDRADIPQVRTEEIMSATGNPLEIYAVNGDDRAAITLDARPGSSEASIQADEIRLDAPKVTASGTIDATGKIKSAEAGKILWSGAWYVNASQIGILSERISDQPNGVIFCFNEYLSGGGTTNYNWIYHVVPKEHVARSNGQGTTFLTTVGGTPTVSRKYIYISDDKFQGQAANSSAPNNLHVLREVRSF